MAKQAQNNNNILNIGNIDSNFVAGLNRSLDSINKLARVEQARKQASDEYKKDFDYNPSTASESDKKAYKDYMKSYNKAVTDASKQADGITTLILTKYTDFDFTAGDYTLFNVKALESFLRNIGVLVGDIDKCKDKQKDTAQTILVTVRGYLNQVTNRKTASMGKRYKGNAYITYKQGKELANTSIEYVLALIDGLASTDAIIKEVDDKGNVLSVSNKYAK